MAFAMASPAPSYQCVFSRFVDSYRDRRHGVKLLARHANVSVRTAENWFAEKHAARAEQLIVLMANCDELKAEIDALVAMLKPVAR